MSTSVIIEPPSDYLELIRRNDARLRLERREEEIARARSEESSTSTKELEARVRDATGDTWRWLTEFTMTYNQHWVEEGRPSPREPFPNKPYFRPTLDFIEANRITCVEKSRDMMLSWLVCGFFTKNAQTVHEREIVIQTMELRKGIQLIDYATALYMNQPEWLRDAFPVPKPPNFQAESYFEFKNGSTIIAIPGGAGALRSYHPWGYFNDETSFQPEAGECYNEALSACMKMILNSSAGPGWFQYFKNDIKMVGH
jgi:hypothetical protein